MDHSSIGDECNESLPPDERSESDRGEVASPVGLGGGGLGPTNRAGNWQLTPGY